jgi:hypothetical protein
VRSDLDLKLARVLELLEIQVARSGRMLTCSACLMDATYTCGGLCGPCRVFGNRAWPSDFRIPAISAGRTS